MDCEFSKKEIIVPPIDPEDQREEGGECPECDFEIATVTFSADGCDANIVLPVIDTDQNEDDALTAVEHPISDGETIICQVVLYKGNAFGQSSSSSGSVTITTTGGVVDDYGDLYITGDGAWTITYDGGPIE